MKKTILTTLLAAVAAITIHAQFLFRIQGEGYTISTLTNKSGRN